MLSQSNDCESMKTTSISPQPIRTHQDFYGTICYCIELLLPMVVPALNFRGERGQNPQKVISFDQFVTQIWGRHEKNLEGQISPCSPPTSGAAML